MTPKAVLDAPIQGQLVRSWSVFGRLLRRAGLAVTIEQTTSLLRALPWLDLGCRRDVRDAARSILAIRRSQYETFDRAFDLFWRAELARGRPPRALGELKRRSRRRPVQRLGVRLASPEASSPEVTEPRIEQRATYSERERLRYKDFAALDAAERAAVLRLMRAHPLTLPPRRLRRTRPVAEGGVLDLRRTLAASRCTAGEPLRLMRRRPRSTPRPLVVLCDISGSMEHYARLFLQLLYTLRVTSQRLEAFVFGTRLTCITRELAQRDVDEALDRAAAKVVDWGGGTRIGESLRRFNFDWSRRVLGQGAVVLVISDGWDRGDLTLLDRETGRLARSCTRLIWLNPLLGSPGYEPLTAGIRTVLRHVDDFLPVHNLSSLEQLGRHLATLDRRSRPVRNRRGELERA